jgi:hypothetical protein
MTSLLCTNCEPFTIFTNLYFDALVFSVLSDPAKRLEYDLSGCYEINQYTLRVRFSCSLARQQSLHIIILALRLIVSVLSCISGVPYKI